MADRQILTNRGTLLGSLAAAVAVGGAALGLLTLGPGDPPPAAPHPAARPAAAPGDPAAAVARRQEWLRGHPDDHASWAALGADYVEQARRTADPSYYPKSQAALERSLKLRGPERNVDAAVGMGALANARHDFAAARDWGERARRAAPGNWTVYPVLVDAYTQLGDYPRATAAVQRLLDLKPSLPAFARAAYELQTHGRPADSAAALHRALGLANDPADRAFCLHRLGELDWERGDIKSALARYEAALAADPTAHAALAGRARARAALGDTAAALADYQRLTARVPLPEYVLALGELYESLGRGKQAREQYDVLRAEVELFAANGVTDDLTLGLFEADHGSPARAVRTLRAEWARRHSVLVADALGWALHRAGRDEEALPYARQPDRLGWRGASFAYHQGEIDRSLGRDTEARAHLKEALRLNPHFSPLQAPAARKALTGLDGTGRA
ncbi:tetratricopeptide repeat protein [Streptomyces sp. NPDC050085]|uniref:tetratricopeptide repeat protein n=1 Tax=Streptomyces sp. NPDC050085 TaxID=3365600 RepID=UPI003790BD17